jgi:Protein of unknown function (DUF3467)
MADTPQDHNPGQVHVSLEVPEAHRGGVWADFARVTNSPYEFTLDFARLDFATAPDMQGVVVARVNLSPMLVTQLIRALETNWQAYAARAISSDVRDQGDQGR